MALYPCSACHNRYRGPSQAAYPAIVRGTVSNRAHLRLCPPDFEQLLEYSRKHLQEVVYDQPSTVEGPAGGCSWCLGDTEQRDLVFVTAYPKGSEQIQFYGEVCTDCRSTAATHLGIAA